MWYMVKFVTESEVWYKEFDSINDAIKYAYDYCNEHDKTIGGYINYQILEVNENIE